MTDEQGKQPHDEPEHNTTNSQNETGKPATPDSSKHGNQKSTNKNKNSGGSKSNRVKPLGEQDKTPNGNDDIADPMSSRDPSIM